MQSQSFVNTVTAWPVSAAPSAASRDVLAKVVEAEIIPRLLMAHRAAQCAAPLPAIPQSRAEIANFAALLVSDDMTGVHAYLQARRTKGDSIESIFLGLFTETGRYLGEMWGNDSCGFSEVTLAAWRLRQVLHELSPAFQTAAGRGETTSRRLLLCPVVGEQHTFGLAMVGEFFKRAGWDVDCDIPVSNEHLAETVASQWLDLIGLSSCGESGFGELRSTIAAIRDASRNPDLRVMVGGWAFLDKPGASAELGADFMARDARDAVAKADWYVRSPCAAGS